MSDYNIEDDDLEYLLSVLDEYPQDSQAYTIREDLLDQKYQV
jgi:hypothetical protein